MFPQKVLCQLATEEDDTVAQRLMKHMGVAPKEYYLKVLRKVWGLLLLFLFPTLRLEDVIMRTYTCTSMQILPFVVFQRLTLQQQNIEKSCSSLGIINQRYCTVKMIT